MYSKTPTGKASKGSVSILVSNGRLQLRLRYAGKRHYLSLGFSDTPQNRKLAEMKAREIELDILSGHFDQSLAKYKPHSAFTTESPDITPKVTPTIQELWEQYTNYKSSSVKETTQHYYTSFSRLFERLGDVPLMDALQVKARLENVTTVQKRSRLIFPPLPVTNQLNVGGKVANGQARIKRSQLGQRRLLKPEKFKSHLFYSAVQKMANRSSPERFTEQWAK